MKFLLVCFIFLFLFTGCQNEEVIDIQEEIEINEEVVAPQEEAETSEEIIESSEENITPLKERSMSLFALFGKNQKEIINLFEETPRLVIEEEKIANIDIESASGLYFREENIAFYFFEGRMVEIFLPVGNIFLGYEIKETLEEENVIALFGEPDERVLIEDYSGLLYFIEEGAILFVKETEEYEMHISLYPAPE
jgi:hypothetical protein